MIVIHHNPKCGTSRNVLKVLHDAGETPVIVDYMTEGWTRSQLLALFAASGLTARAALRVERSPAGEMGLLEDGTTDDAIIDAMVNQPELVQRPIVASPKGVRLCRPCESVFDLLESLPPGPIYKEDGQMILNDKGERVV